MKAVAPCIVLLEVLHLKWIHLNEVAVHGQMQLPVFADWPGSNSRVLMCWWHHCIIHM